MSFFTLDPNQAGGFEPMPIGEYEAIVTQAEVKTSSAGNPMISVQLTVRDDVDQEGKKRKIFDNFVATEKAMFKFHQFGKAAGVAAAASIEAFAASMLYKPVRIKNKHEPYNGSVSDKVAAYLEPKFAYAGGGNSNVPDPFAIPGGGGDDPFKQDGIPLEINDDDLPF